MAVQVETWRNSMAALCSARLLQPLIRFVSEREELRDLVPEPLRSLDPNSRIPLELAHGLLERAIERLGDEHLGLKHGRTWRFGEGGPFDYAVRSAATVRESVNVAGRYSKLFADSFRVWFEPWRSHGLIRLFDEAFWSRAGAEFTMSVIYNGHLANGLPAAAKIECWFPYSTPSAVSEHQRSFHGARLRFNAPFFGFAFPGVCENAPMPGADPVLHSTHCYHVDSVLAEVAGSTRVRLRHAIEQSLRSQGQPIATHVAQALGMSARTLNRRLKEEGGTFATELEGVRRELAHRYVAESSMPFTEIAFLLGFLHVPSFYRWFRGWTGRTPLEYRQREL
jgi:AraC-like DNA-binding protein